MKEEPLNRHFFEKPTLTIAPNLLGCFLNRKIDNKVISGQIVEVEAYLGEQDRASHAYRGLTPRNAVMFGTPGQSYVYLIYGIYHCLNIVTESEGLARAILIRALALPEANGPGKLCRLLDITRELNNIDITQKEALWISGRLQTIHKSDIIETTRIGVEYAGEDAQKPWRFYLKNNHFVSKQDKRLSD